MLSILKTFSVPILFISIWISFSFLNLSTSDGNTDLLKEGTSVLYERYNEIPIHCGAYPKLEECFEGAFNSPFEKSILFGNSQLHAVNNISQNAELVALRLFKKFKENNEYIFTVSYGNANFEEFFWALNKIISNLKVKRIYVACVFDDMRETGLRPEMQDQDITNYNLAESGEKKNKPIYILPEMPLQDITEEAIKVFFTDTPAWNTRYELKYRINLTLRSIRNVIFGITPETKRKILPYAYERNIGYLSKILNIASQNNIETVLYIAPLLQDEDIPYVLAEYEKYKYDIQNIANLYDAKFYNFENIVPNEAWGLKQSTQLGSNYEKDYMHFTETGHIILSNQLIKSITE